MNNTIILLGTVLGLAAFTMNSFYAEPASKPTTRKIIYKRDYNPKSSLFVVESEPVPTKITVGKIEFLHSEGGTYDALETVWKLYAESNGVETELWSYKRIGPDSKNAEPRLYSFQILDAAYFGEKSFCIVFISSRNIYVGVSNADGSLSNAAVHLEENDAGKKFLVEKGTIVGNPKEKSLKVQLFNSMNNGAMTKYNVNVGFAVEQK